MKFKNYLNYSSLSLSLEGRGRKGAGETPQKRNYILSIFLFILLTFLLSPALVFATPQVPRTIVFQGILVDAGGNPLVDISSANANISIVDGAGDSRYEEQQTITLYQGATAFLVGMGTNPDTGELTGGIPLDVMEPGEGDLILKIKIEGQTIAQEDVIFASVPFSFYSQYATQLTQPVESEQIKDGAITVSHLSEEVTTYVKSLGVSKEELEEHKTEEAAHAGENISVRNTFKNLMGTDLQMLMESVDYNITLANKASEVAASSIDSNDIENEQVKQADLDMNTFNGWDKNEADDLTASTVFGGALSGVYSDLQLADNSVNTNNIVDGAVTASKLAESYLSTTGGTLTGNLVMENTDIVMSDNNTVDGVDVSELKNTVDTIQSAGKILASGQIHVDQSSGDWVHNWTVGVVNNYSVSFTYGGTSKDGKSYSSRLLTGATITLTQPASSNLFVIMNMTGELAYGDYYYTTDDTSTLTIFWGDLNDGTGVDFSFIVFGY